MSCKERNHKGQATYSVDPSREIVYDGCEYLKFGFGEHATMAHKGNCINPIHKPCK